MKNTGVYNSLFYMEIPGIYFILYSSKFNLEYNEILEIFFGSVFLLNGFNC